MQAIEIKKVVLAVVVVLGLCGLLSAKTVNVLSHQKISDTEGNFSGILENGDKFSYNSIELLGDIDGDTVSDIAVGMNFDDDGGTYRGAVWILFMNTDGTVKSHQKISDTQGNFTGVLDNWDQLGCSVASIGDFDGDEVNDIAVGAVWDGDGGSGRGAVWILFLNADGTVKGHQKISDTQGNFTGTLWNGAGLGSSSSNIGDLDGDGIIDIAVGSSGFGNGGIGAAWILFLNSDGTVKTHTKIVEGVGGFTGNLDNDDRFGSSIEWLGDLDGDGVNDIAVGARGDDDGGTDRGAVWILFLNSDGTVKSHQKISNTEGGFTGTLDNVDQFGFDIINVGDLDDDGVIDIVASADVDDDGGTDRGAVWILFLNSDGTVKAHQKISDTEGNFTGILDDVDEFGSSVGFLGDLNKDGFTDIAVGARNDDDGGDDRGAVWVLFLQETGVTYHVDGVSGDNSNDGLSYGTAFETIQMGIDTAEDCDTVLVWPGVYNESLFFVNKGITVRSVADAAELVASGIYAVSFYTSEGPSSVLRNFVIRDSDTAVFVSSGAPSLEHLTIVNCEVGIDADFGADPDVRNCILHGNSLADLIGCAAEYSWVEEEAEPNLVAYWKFDEGSGSIAYDWVGENDGTLYGATWTGGQVGGALEFDGSNDYVDCGDGANLDDMTAITISAWIYPTGWGGNNYGRIVSKRFHSESAYEISVGGQEKSVHSTYYGDNDISSIAASENSISLNQWYHVVATNNGTQQKIYVNGYEDGSNNVDTGDIMDVSANLWIGQITSAYVDRAFEGKIDEVGIWDRPLSAEEIEDMYRIGLAGHQYPDPLFADANAGDYHLLSERGRYWPAEDVWVLDEVSSPCIDGGDPNVEPSGEPTPNGGRINMGAYGNTAYASMSEWVPASDTNRDGIVNFVDFAVLADEWLNTVPWAQ